VVYHTYYTVAGGRSVAYTVLVWSRLNAPVELSYRYTQRGYTTPDDAVRVRPWNKFAVCVINRLIYWT